MFTRKNVVRILAGFAMLVGLLALNAPARAQTTDYERAGWTTTLTTNAHDVSGTAEIIDARTVRLRNFNYDGGGPEVYAYLGATDSNTAFEEGIPIGPLLTRPSQAYVNETIDLVLPEGSTLDGYNAISIWCVDFKVNFGSGTFTAPAEQSRIFLPLLR